MQRISEPGRREKDELCPNELPSRDRWPWLICCATRGFTSARAALASSQNTEPEGVSTKTQIVPSLSQCIECFTVN